MLVGWCVNRLVLGLLLGKSPRKRFHWSNGVSELALSQPCISIQIIPPNHAQQVFFAQNVTLLPEEGSQVFYVNEANAEGVYSFEGNVGAEIVLDFKFLPHLLLGPMVVDLHVEEL